MSQPYNRGARIAAPGQLDAKLQEFWVENPWEIVREGHNLSAFERNRAFLNLRGQGFVDISFVSGADSDGDGRAAVTGDFRNNGQLDLVVRQVGGGPILLYENRFPPRRYLKVSLRGRQTNRLGIGSRITVEAGGLSMVRELYPINTFQSHAPSLAHFGLADADRVDRLTVRWLSGKVQTFENLPADCHIVIDEGMNGPEAVSIVTPGQLIPP